MLTRPFAAGSPNWTDLATPDIDEATGFYGGLFGWTFQSAGPEAGGYGMFQLDGKTVAGAMAVPPDQAPPSWSIYFQTPDAQVTAKAVTKGGGSVVLKPTDVMDIGRMSVFNDPSGAGFSAWQPGHNKGLGLVDQPGSLFWTELYTPDEAAAYGFYRSVFGWESLTMPMPGDGGSYRMVHPAGRSPDSMFGGLVPLGSDPLESDSSPHWLLYFAVDDCDAAVRTAERLGGTVRLAPTDIEGVGRFAKLTDPYGAEFAVMRGVSQDA